jgi:succinate-semialdehyde dehydrogenase / glutarate-semialdehyde dehydrogenase
VSIESINPYTGALLRKFEPYDSGEVDHRLTGAITAFRSWRETSFAERAALMRRAADVLDSEKARWGELMTVEMGKPIRSAVAEAE